LFSEKYNKNIVPENTNIPNRRDLNFLGDEGSVRPKNLKKFMKLGISRGVGGIKKISLRLGVNGFSVCNCTFSISQ